ncbi:hypothetical protein FKM82_000940 [Ascaphus truei]
MDAVQELCNKQRSAAFRTFLVAARGSWHLHGLSTGQEKLTFTLQGEGLLTVPRISVTPFGARAFSHAAPTL